MDKITYIIGYAALVASGTAIIIVSLIFLTDYLWEKLVKRYDL